MKLVGKPDAGNRHVRFDERGQETECCHMAQATAPVLDSTVRRMSPWGLGRENAVLPIGHCSIAFAGQSPGSTCSAGIGRTVFFLPCAIGVKAH